MSVILISADELMADEMSNGTWKAIVALARAYEGERVPDWSGFHDGQQTAPMEQTLRDLAKHGGATLS